MIEEFEGKRPRISRKAFVHPSATVIGDVRIGDFSSVWPGAVIRGDSGRITIGKYTCVQDNAVIHTGDVYDSNVRTSPAKIGNYVIIGHNALIHGAFIEDQTLIGGGAIIFNDALVRRGAIVGIGAVVPREVEIPPRTVVVGIPARPLRQVTTAEFRGIKTQAVHYAKLAARYLRGRLRGG